MFILNYDTVFSSTSLSFASLSFQVFLQDSIHVLKIVENAINNSVTNLFYNCVEIRKSCAKTADRS